MESTYTYFVLVIKQDLIKDLKSELSGNVEELVLALFMPTTYYDAWSLRNAMKVQYYMSFSLNILSDFKKPHELWQF